jgi:DNA ligase D-like protein (predicted 3'-phosphoesterase)
VARRAQTKGLEAIRASLPAAGQGPDHVERILAQAGELGLLGWVRDDPDGRVRIHAEGAAGAPAQLVAALQHGGAAVEVEKTKVEGHEQFAVRGVSAGVFVVQEHQATAHHYDFRLEVDGVMRSWAVPKGPSLDPAVKRLAVQVPDHGTGHNSFEGAGHGGGVIIWDRGTYEQGGRVPWPEALDRGHAVFVLHGEKLEGGFALQRTGRGDPPQWLLIKRRDEHARAGSDVVAERPESVVTGRTLGETIDA